MSVIQYDIRISIRKEITIAYLETTCILLLLSDKNQKYNSQGKNNPITKINSKYSNNQVVS